MSMVVRTLGLITDAQNGIRRGRKNGWKKNSLSMTASTNEIENWKGGGFNIVNKQRL
jgi:hypothetical protein